MWKKKERKKTITCLHTACVMSAKCAEDAAVLSVSLALGPFNDGDTSLEKLLLKAALFFHEIHLIYLTPGKTSCESFNSGCLFSWISWITIYAHSKKMHKCFVVSVAHKRLTVNNSKDDAINLQYNF